MDLRTSLFFVTLALLAAAVQVVSPASLNTTHAVKEKSGNVATAEDEALSAALAAITAAIQSANEKFGNVTCIVEDEALSAAIAEITATSSAMWKLDNIATVEDEALSAAIANITATHTAKENLGNVTAGGEASPSDVATTSASPRRCTKEEEESLGKVVEAYFNMLLQLPGFSNPSASAQLITTYLSMVKEFARASYDLEKSNRRRVIFGLTLSCIVSLFAYFLIRIICLCCCSQKSGRCPPYV